MRMRFLFASAAFAALCTISTQASAQATGSVCTDGSSSATTGRGACSGHGGVDKKATKAAHKAMKAKAMVSCTDGTMSKGGRGACSSHGGVAANASAAAPMAPTPAAAPAPATPAARPPAMAPAATPAPAPPSDRVRSTTKASSSSSNSSNETGGSGKPEDTDPTGAVAKCKDGMYSHSAHRTGSCSGHGGVAQWLVS